MRPWEPLTSNPNQTSLPRVSAAHILPAPRSARVDAAVLDDELITLVRRSIVDALATTSPAAGTLPTALAPSSTSSTSTNSNSSQQHSFLSTVVHAAHRVLAFLRNAPVSYDAELDALLRFLLLGIPLLRTSRSIGLQLQSLVLRDERKHTGTNELLHVVHRASLSQRIVAVLLIVGGPYLALRIQRYMAKHDWQRAQSNRSTETLSPQTKRRIFIIFTRTQTTIQWVSLLHFLLFLTEGKYRTLIERILRIRPVLSQREIDHTVSFEYMNRQIVWNAFTEFVLCILPLLNFSRIKRAMNVATTAASGALHKVGFTNLTSSSINGNSNPIFDKYPLLCPICADQHPDEMTLLQLPTTLESSDICKIKAESEDKEADHKVNDKVNDESEFGINQVKREELLRKLIAQTPYVSYNPSINEKKCSHTFCYYCIKAQLMTDDGFCCPTCMLPVGPKVIPSWYKMQTV